MNKCIFTGRFTKDPEVRYSQGEKPMAIAHFTLAVERNRKRKDGDPTADFPRFIAFGKTAEFIEKYMGQGIKAEIESQLQTGSYVNHDGQTVYTTEFLVERIGFAESKKTFSNASSTDNTGTENSADEGAEDKFMSIAECNDCELPFA